jgi:hypothetical protein
MYFYVAAPIPQIPFYAAVPHMPGNPGIPTTDTVRGSWTSHEDDLLRAAVQRLGTSHWDAIAAVVKGRTATQCRERWLFRLSPGLKKAPVEKWEDDIILEQRKKVGNHWTLIAAGLPGRTSCSVKNRWYTVLRKKHQALEQAEQTSPEVKMADSEASPMQISSLLSKKAVMEETVNDIPKLCYRKGQ